MQSLPQLSWLAITIRNIQRLGATFLTEIYTFNHATGLANCGSNKRLPARFLLRLILAKYVWRTNTYDPWESSL